MSKINIMTAMVMVNALTACSAYEETSDVNTGWIRFTEEQPVPKPVAALAKPVSKLVTPMPKIASGASSNSSSIALPVPALQPMNNKLLGDNTIVKAGGSGVPLLSAISRIAPSTWKATLSAAVTKEFKSTLSWSAGESWISTIDKMLSQQGLKAVYNNGTKNIEIVFDSQLKNDIKRMNTKITQSSVITSPPLTLPKIWKIEKGSTLKTGYSLWVAKETCPVGDGKWKIQSLTDTDYPIDYPLSFSSNNFEEVTNQLFNLYRNAEVPLYVSGHRNQCLIIISDKK